jgi:hypothetical protein
MRTKNSILKGLLLYFLNVLATLVWTSMALSALSIAVDDA